MKKISFLKFIILLFYPINIFSENCCDLTILPENIKVTNLFPYYLGSGETDRCKIEVRISNLSEDSCTSGGVVQILSKRVDRSPGYGGHYLPLPFDKDNFSENFSSISASDMSSTITLFWTLPSDFCNAAADEENAGVWRLVLRVIPISAESLG